jgi:SAM-dependent methyltransferase
VRLDNVNALRFESLAFAAPPERTIRFGQFCLTHISAERPERVLEIGCGTGEQILYLAAQRPAAEFVGVDISPLNIDIAARAAVARAAARVTFRTADFMKYDDSRFDVIIADSVLQTIPAADDELYARLASLMIPGGRLVISIPFDCAYNRALIILRRLARPLRGKGLDVISLGIGRLLHSSWDIELLRERLPYLYLVPERLDNRKMRAALTRRFGLILAETARQPHISAAQLKHRAIVYRRAA